MCGQAQAERQSKLDAAIIQDPMLRCSVLVEYLFYFCDMIEDDQHEQYRAAYARIWEIDERGLIEGLSKVFGPTAYLWKAELLRDVHAALECMGKACPLDGLELALNVLRRQQGLLDHQNPFVDREKLKRLTDSIMERAQSLVLALDSWYAEQGRVWTFFAPERKYAFGMRGVLDRHISLRRLEAGNLPRSDSAQAVTPEQASSAAIPAGGGDDDDQGTAGGVPVQTSKLKRLRRRRRKTDLPLRPLTPKQAEAVHIVGECKGNLAEAARRLGIDRKTLQERYETAQAKLGQKAVKHRTQRLPSDRRGQESLSYGDDRRG